MELPEMGEHRFGTEPQRAGAARVEPRWGLAHELAASRLEAECGEERERVGLGIEDPDGRGRARPVPAGAGEGCPPQTHAACEHELVLRLVPAVGLTDLEHRQCANAAIAV